MILKLGVPVVDRATGLKGMLTHAEISISGRILYQFRPQGLDKDTQHPVKGMWIDVDKRIEGELVDVDMPMEVLGTEVKEVNSGFKGMAVGLVQHISGCVHVVIQPKGQTKNGDPIGPLDTDILLLEGKAIPKKTEVEQTEHKKKFPSPAPVTESRFGLVSYEIPRDR